MDKKNKPINKNKLKLEETTNLLKKVQADFENYQKRTEKEKQEFTKYACGEIVKELLPILDSFELAIRNTKNKDIEAIYSQLWQMLSSQGVKRIKSLNEKFDPYLHEALLQEESNKEEGTILEELQSGYTLNDVLIRPTKVKIAKK